MLNPGSREALGSNERQTLMVNAAIMDAGSNPANFPWFVQFRLPSFEERTPLKFWKMAREEDVEQSGTKKQSLGGGFGFLLEYGVQSKGSEGIPCSSGYV